jgi:hypothetical protein
MTTQKQIEANQQNAFLSTGPKTQEGKEIVSQNAVTHGIFSKNIIAHDESEDEFKFLESEFYNLFKPEGILETFLLERAIAATWRLSRIGKIEPILIKLASQKWDGKDLSEIFDNYLGARLALMSRYEVTLERALFKALNELKSLQDFRKKNLTESKC